MSPDIASFVVILCAVFFLRALVQAVGVWPIVVVGGFVWAVVSL